MKFLIYVFVSVFTFQCYSQEFKMTRDTLICSNDGLLSFEVNVDSIYTTEKTKINAEIDFAKSTLYTGSATLHYDKADLIKTKGKQKFVIEMTNEEYRNKISRLVIMMNLTKADGTEPSDKKELVILIKHSQVQQYKYLAYIGTNFDLVDGIKAKNLFFAANVYLAPSENWDLGIYTSIYGNRTMTFRDSVEDHRRIYQIGIDDVTNLPYKIEQSSNRASLAISDNIGAYFSPLLSLGIPRFFDKQLRVFFSPSLEFLWRRTSINTSYTDGQLLDPVQISATEYNGNITYSLSESQVLTSNVYDFNIGYFGLFFAHENESISIRLHFSMGHVRRYLSNSTTITRSGEEWGYFNTDHDDFLSGKLWITERNSGVTLQAEIINYNNKPNPFFGVTLSKAIDFGKIGTIFSPLSRTPAK